MLPLHQGYGLSELSTNLRSGLCELRLNLIFRLLESFAITIPSAPCWVTTPARSRTKTRAQPLECFFCGFNFQCAIRRGVTQERRETGLFTTAKALQDYFLFAKIQNR